MEIILFALLGMFFEFCFSRKEYNKKIITKILYYILLLFIITIFEIEFREVLLETIYLYGIQEYTFGFRSILNISIIYILVPMIVIFIRLKLEKISFNKNFFRRFNIYLLIYVLAFVLTYIIGHYTGIITFKESFL